MSRSLPMALAALLVCAAVVPPNGGVSASGAPPVYLAPPAGAEGTAAALLFFQGFGLEATQYTRLASGMQNRSAAKGVRLYVGIMQFIDSIPEPLQAPSLVSAAVTALRALGLPVSAPQVAAGHSLGGVVANAYVAGHASEFSAVGLLGSFIVSADNATVVTPTMTIGGELDGLCRITRIAEAYLLQVNQSSNGSPDPRRDFPVTIVQGMTHMQFGEGAVPKKVLDNDLVPQVTTAAAQAEVAELFASFLAVQLNGDEAARAPVEASMQRAMQWFAPILASYEMEGSYRTKPPCNCNPPLREPYRKDVFGFIQYYPCPEDEAFPWCRAGSSWAEIAQARMWPEAAALGVRFNVTSAFHPLSQTKPNSNNPIVFAPGCADPGNCTSCQQTSGCSETITVVNENAYQRDEFGDTGFMPQSALEIGHKQMSRQALQFHAVVPDTWSDAAFARLDGGSLCAEVNQAALEWALEHAPAGALADYRASGQQLVMGNDTVAAIGPEFVYGKLTFTGTPGAMVVTSVALKHALIPTHTGFHAAGFHYCKLLSPARALEWLLLDSRREKHSLIPHADGKVPNYG